MDTKDKVFPLMCPICNTATIYVYNIADIDGNETEALNGAEKILQRNTLREIFIEICNDD